MQNTATSQEIKSFICSIDTTQTTKEMYFFPILHIIGHVVYSYLAKTGNKRKPSNNDNVWFQELVELAQQDNKKLEELKHAQAELEKLLQEETQAKRDEEIVRALQARWAQLIFESL